MWEKLTPAQREATMQDLFGPNGIHLSFLRQPMGATDLALSNYTYDDVAPGETDPDMTQFSIAHDQAYIIPTIKAALAVNPQIKVMALPWSPPAWMKTSGSTGGGTLNTQYFPALAKYFTKFIQAYEANGIPINYVAVQNEPLYETGGYPNYTANIAHPGVYTLHVRVATQVAGGVVRPGCGWAGCQRADQCAADQRLADMADARCAGAGTARGRAHSADGDGHGRVLQHHRELDRVCAGLKTSGPMYRRGFRLGTNGRLRLYLASPLVVIVKDANGKPSIW